MRSQPTLNHTGELKAAFCCTSRCASSSWKMAASSARAEVAAGHAPVANGLSDASDQGADTALALGRADLAVQIFAGDNVGRRHRPVLGDLDIFLLEDDAALRVGDLRQAQFPLELVVRRDAGSGEVALESQAGRLLRRLGDGGARRGGRAGGDVGHVSLLGSYEYVMNASRDVTRFVLPQTMSGASSLAGVLLAEKKPPG